MPVGKRKLPYADKPVHLAARLFAVKRARFRIATGQIAVAFQPVFINHVLERTGHGSKRKHLVVHNLVAYNEHAVAVVIPMPAQLVKIALCHVRRFCEHVAAPLFLVLDKPLHCLHHLRALGHEQR